MRRLLSAAQTLTDAFIRLQRAKVRAGKITSPWYDTKHLYDASFLAEVDKLDNCLSSSVERVEKQLILLVEDWAKSLENLLDKQWDSLSNGQEQEGVESSLVVSTVNLNADLLVGSVNYLMRINDDTQLCLRETDFSGDET